MKTEKTNNNSFIRWMVMVNMISIIIVGFYLAANTGVFLAIRTNADYRGTAIATSVNVAHVLESMSDDDFEYFPESGILKKGDIIITDEAFKKSLEYDENIHHTIFWGNTRIITDVKNNNGRTVVGTTLDDQKIINAINRDGIYTANNVPIYGSKYTVCYYPLKMVRKLLVMFSLVLTRRRPMHQLFWIRHLQQPLLCYLHLSLL